MVKKPPANAGDTGDTSSIPGPGRYPRERNGNPLQHSCLGNPIDRGAWQATVLGVTKKLDTGEATEHAHTSREEQRHETASAQVIYRTFTLHRMLFLVLGMAVREQSPCPGRTDERSCCMLQSPTREQHKGRGWGALKRQHLCSHLRNESWDSKAETGDRHVERDERPRVGSTRTEGAWRQTHLINARFLRTVRSIYRLFTDSLKSEKC